MLARLLSRSPSLRLVTRLSYPQAASHLPFRPPAVSPSSTFFASLRPFSVSGGGGKGGGGDDKFDSWKFSPEDAGKGVFGSEEGDLSGISDEPDQAPVPDSTSSEEVGLKGDVFGHIDEEIRSKDGADDDWLRGEGEYKPWSFGGDREEVEKVFDVGDVGSEGLPYSMVGGELEEDKRAEDAALEKEEQELSLALKGPNRAFGDLISASGITESMLDSLIALKDLEGIEGLPPLSEIEDIRLAKAEKKSTRAEIERKKQEEIAKSYVRQVDNKGRAYGTGRRKCSVARVWIQPGDGKFIINDKQFDVYFPIIDHRASLLRPFTETKTLGRWDVSCTVKGGGVSGQVGAVRLGISRALQNWEPGLRPYLRSVGFLTRDSRVVERKKPGKAKARKSFQWVKR